MAGRWDCAVTHDLTEQQQAQWAKLNRLAAEHKAELEAMGYRVLLPRLGQGRAAA